MTDSDFYQLQNEWSNIYFREVGDADNKKAAWVESISNRQFRKILELGAGGGQFSIAMAQKGYSVTALEIEPQFTEHMEKAKADHSLENLTILTGDFHSVKLSEKFDLICYWDGFGVGSDEDQKRLLRNVSEWLSPEGAALIEVYTPWFWAAKAAGITNQMGDIIRMYEFDAENCCLVDTWWHKNQPTKRIAQHLRCYSPADLKLLSEPINLKIEEIYTGGYVDFETGEYLSEVPLHQAMSYTAKFVHKK
jgi:SAM-dependent methyltransferase